MIARVRRALLSVSNQQGVAALAQGLASQGVELLGTSGTARALQAAGVSVRRVSELTRFPELLGGRVKTLHPAIHAGLLARRNDPAQMAELRRHGLGTIDLVAVNLYPFERTLEADCSLEAALEQIDIGGETLLRAAAKNFPDVVVLVDPADYEDVVRQLSARGDLALSARRELARKAFAHVTRYNAAIARYFDPDPLPQTWSVVVDKTQALRYGENPQQRSALYGEALDQLWGKDLSYTNVLDLDAAWRTVARASGPAVAIVKHATPCGVAQGRSPRLAFERALAGDAQSAFGGVVGVNRAVGLALARQLVSHFFEAVVAPDFSEAALATLKTKKNVRLVRAPQRPMTVASKTTSWGTLVQTTLPQAPFRLRVVTQKPLSKQLRRELSFAWQVVQQVKSNAIVLVKDGATVGIGAGQMSRVDAVFIALEKAKGRARGAVLASDGFFPFPDGVELAAAAGVAAIVQPGGSIRDREVIRTADRHGLAMGLTSQRVFRHG